MGLRGALAEAREKERGGEIEGVIEVEYFKSILLKRGTRKVYGVS